MSENVKNAVDAYLDRVASSLPLEKRANVRAVQAALTRGTHLPNALRRVYGMTAKEAFDLARGIVKSAGAGSSVLGGVAGAVGGAAGGAAGKAVGQAVSSAVPNVSGAVNKMTGGRFAPYLPSVAGAQSTGRALGSSLARMAKAGAEDEDDGPEFPNFAQESMKTFTGPFSQGQSFLSSH